MNLKGWLKNLPHRLSKRQEKKKKWHKELSSLNCNCKKIKKEKMVIILLWLIKCRPKIIRYKHCFNFLNNHNRKTGTFVRLCTNWVNQITFFPNYSTNILKGYSSSNATTRRNFHNTKGLSNSIWLRRMNILRGWTIW